MTDEIEQSKGDVATDFTRWTPAKMTVFSRHMGATGSVRRAAEEAGMSANAAYELRQRPEGVAFRIAWEAALLIARGRLADDTLEWAIWGREEEVVRTLDRDAGTITTTRKRHESRLAMSVLARLDNRIAAPPGGDRDAHAARIVAQDFAGFLDLVAAGGDAMAVSIWIAARDPEKQAEIRALEQCHLLAEQQEKVRRARLLIEAETMATHFAAQDPHRIWMMADGQYMTDYPPGPDFCGTEQGHYGVEGYCRSASEDELTGLEIQDKSRTLINSEKQELLRRSAFGLDPIDGALPPRPDWAAQMRGALPQMETHWAAAAALQVEEGMLLARNSAEKARIREWRAHLRQLRQMDNITRIEAMDPAKIRISDLHPSDDTTQWSDEKWARAVHSGWIDKNMPGWERGA